MTLFIITALIGVFSLLFMGFVLMRFYGYARKHPLPESKYTLILGIIDTGHITILYVFSIVALFVATLVFVISLNLM